MGVNSLPGAVIVGCDVNLTMLKYTLIFLTFRNTGGFLNTPTPGGVPVKNTSPGQRVTNLQEKTIRREANL